MRKLPDASIGMLDDRELPTCPAPLVREKLLSGLDGKCAVILGVGASRNIGQAIARRFAAEGATVIIAGHNSQMLATLAAELGARALHGDITDGGSLDRLFESAGGAVDIAVNTVGRNLFRPFMETTATDMDELFRVHVTGALLFTQSAVRAMPAGGSIVHISSLSAKMVIMDHVAYMATKAAGEVVVKAAAYEFGARGIRVNAIAPALTHTPMTEPFFADAALIANASRQSPLRRLGNADDVAAACVWLASDECFVTGETLQVNGGMAMHGMP